MKKHELTSEERRAISALQRVAKIWPDTLWIFAEGGRLTVMKKDADGHRAVTENGGMDQNYIEERVPIEADGGDW